MSSKFTEHLSKNVKIKKVSPKNTRKLRLFAVFFVVVDFHALVARTAIAVAISLAPARGFAFFAVDDDVGNRKHNPQRYRYD